MNELLIHRFHVLTVMMVCRGPLYVFSLYLFIYLLHVGCITGKLFFVRIIKGCYQNCMMIFVKLHNPGMYALKNKSYQTRSVFKSLYVWIVFKYLWKKSELNIISVCVSQLDVLQLSMTHSNLWDVKPYTPIKYIISQVVAMIVLIY